MAAAPGTAETTCRIRSIMDEPRRSVCDPTDGRAACRRHRIRPTAGQDAGYTCHHGDYTPFGIRVHITRRAAPGVENFPRTDRHGGDMSGRILPPPGTACHHEGQRLAADSFMILTTSSTRHQRPELDAIAARLPLLTARPSPCSTNRHAMPPAVMRCTFSTSSNRTSQTAGNRQRWFLVPASSRIYDATATAWHPFAGFLAFSRKER